MIEDPQNSDFGDGQRTSGPESAGDVDHPVLAAVPGRSRGIHSQQNRDWRLDKSLFVAVCMVLGILMVLLCLSLYVQHRNYRDAIAHGFESGSPINHASVISYSRALDFAVVKTSALFLAFALVFVGALYVLRIAEAEYRLAVGTDGARGSLKTSSPGLVMVTLGVVLIALVLNAKSLVEYGNLPPESPQAAVPYSPSGSGSTLLPNPPEQRFEKPPLSNIPPQSSFDPAERS